MGTPYPPLWGLTAYSYPTTCWVTRWNGFRGQGLAIFRTFSPKAAVNTSTQSAKPETALEGIASPSQHRPWGCHLSLQGLEENQELPAASLLHQKLAAYVLSLPILSIQHLLCRASVQV
jgi:hypothetical protein